MSRALLLLLVLGTLGCSKPQSEKVAAAPGWHSVDQGPTVIGGPDGINHVISWGPLSQDAQEVSASIDHLKERLAIRDELSRIEGAVQEMEIDCSGTPEENYQRRCESRAADLMTRTDKVLKRIKALPR